jgi:phosphoglycerol transferase MdoB-like AlkP superfamily enzyme
VNEFRGMPLQLCDIYSIRTALSVSSSYLKNVHLSATVISSVIACIWVIVFAYRIEKRTENKNRKQRIISRVFSGSVCAILIVLMMCMDVSSLLEMEFSAGKIVTRYGIIGSLYLQAANMRIKPPDNYNLVEMEQYFQDEELEISEDLPNIIVIMNEAFSDYFFYSDDLPINQDYMPFIHQLEKNTEKNWLYVSAWGGNTCNTEYEFLTGNSMAFCSNTIPYQQFIYSQKDSLAGYLSNLGYETIAIHPYYALGYNRNKVYPLLGIQKSYFIDEFDSRYNERGFDSRLDEQQLAESQQGLYVRDLISDQASFQKIIELYESKEAGTPLFLFNVTMQDHAPYTYANYTGNILLEIEHPDKDYLEQYFSLLYETDKAFEKLIGYFEQQDEKTIILMFGDHQPGIGIAWYNYLMGYELGYTDWSLEEYEERYVVPYIMWTNYDTESLGKYAQMSSNYLSAALLEKAQIPLDNWYSFLSELYQEYPVINMYGIMNEAGDWSTVEEQLGSSERLSLYNKLQYYRMFDK